MWKYRYRREYLPDDALLDGCNALGEAGWSMIGPPRRVAGDPAEATAKQVLEAMYASARQEAGES